MAKVLYKYFNYKDGLLVLDNNKVRLNFPKYFNDPFDCNFNINQKNMDKTLDMIVEYGLMKELRRIVENNPSKKLSIIYLRMVFKIYEKIYKVDPRYLHNFLITSILKSKLIPDYIRKEIDDNKEKTRKEVFDKIINYRDNALISCFSKNNQSILMWSHYADKHKGICIEFEQEDDEDFYDVKYQEERQNLDLFEIMSRMLAYEYIGEKVDINISRISSLILAPFLCKSLEWKYEEEVRCIYSLSKLNDKISLDKDNDGNDMYLYKMDKISKVYIGFKMDDVKKERLIELLEEKNIPYVFMEASKDKFLLEIN